MSMMKDLAIRAAARTLAACGDRIAPLYVPRQDPWPLYERLRDRGPVYRSVIGYAAVSSHELCSRVLRGPEFGMRDSAGRLPASQAIPLGMAPSLLELDPPDHSRLRRLVAPAFRPKLINAFRPRIEELAGRLLERAGAGPFDLIADFAAPLPIAVISELLGIPEERRGDFARYGTLTGLAMDGRLGVRERAEFAAATRSMTALFEELAGRRRSDPGEDVISVLAAAVDGERITAGELVSTCQLLLIAGFETTVNLIGNGVHLFGRHREQWELLRADAGLAAGAVEEVLRFDPPVPLTGRVVQREVELGGRRLRRDTQVLTVLAAANRDPAVYADPGVFDIRRAQAAEHFAFSSGVHYCLGAQLARIEGEIAFRVLAERLPGLRAAGAGRLRPSVTIRGFSQLPVAA
ncbi:cytochrome P450 [Nonomuraea sp. NPDC050328]|uniref:cytochrome P450 n=1 Tax=Nonomuraea sp. NPDC050328 TaxID=3364361 RepID=UPI0037A006ED